MKKRTGFVSNSSSSSFCVCGVTFDENIVDKFDPEGCFNILAEAILQNFEAEISDVEELKDYLSNMDGWEVVELFDDEKTLRVKYDRYSEYGIGLGWDDMDDDETLYQFKTRIHTILQKYFGKNTPPVNSIGCVTITIVDN